MKKIGIVTYVKIYNYGSFLQSYALSSFLEQHNYEPLLLDITYNSRCKLWFKIKIFLKLLLHPLAIPQVLKLRNMGKGTINNLSSTIKIEFDKCFKNMLNIVKVEYSVLRKLSLDDKYVAFIAGSDQIWSPLGIEVKPHKFLEFAPKSKRIAYAPSFGVSKIPSYNKFSLQRRLRGINKLSIREESGKKVIEKITNLTPEVVLDPTLMVPVEFWEKMSETVDKKPYLLCYFLNEPEEEYLLFIKSVAEKLNLDILYLPYEQNIQIENSTFVEAGPKDFVSLVKNASFVLTDSFHGTAFSLIFNIPFFTFPRYKNINFEQSSRITDLLNKIGLSDRFLNEIHNDKLQSLSIDFSNAVEKLNEIREHSQRFLLDSLNKD